jgi:hypothetical protein
VLDHSENRGDVQQETQGTLKIWYDKHQPRKRRKAAEDSDHELPGAKLRVVLPDSEAEDDASGSARSPGRGDADEND